METDFLEWYVSGGVTNYVGSKTLPYFGSGGILTPDEASSYLVYALADGRVLANKGAATTVQVSGVAVAPTWVSVSQTLVQGLPTALALVASDAVAYSVVSGSLPAGLALGSDGILTGTVAAAGTYAVVVRAHGAVIGLDADRNFSLTVANVPVWTSAALPTSSKGEPYAQQLAATHAVSFALASGALPVGLALSALGLLSGTPTGNGSFAFTVRATGSASAAISDASFALEVQTAPEWTTAVLSNAAAGVAYSFAFAASYASPTGYSITGGALPPGLSLSPAGVLGGTPTALGSYDFTVRAFNVPLTLFRTRTFTLTIVPLPVWATAPTLPNTAVDVAFSFALSASDASPSGYSITSGALPPGVTLSAAGVLSGTPTALGTYGFTAKVLDATSAVFVTRSFTLAVVAAPVWTTSSLADDALGAVYSVRLSAT